MTLNLTKAKAAQRVVEVLEFFDEQHPQATVMDIVRRYNRPQSSTSELLASLVDLGLLYKDARSRSYTLTPRAAILGSLSQPGVVRDGRLAMLIEDLSDRTGLGIALIGMSGLNAQSYRWKAGARWRGRAAAMSVTGGTQSRLSDSAAGWLLLSTLPPQRREGVLRRLNAEADETARFSPSEMGARIRDCAQRGHAIGPAGFGVDGLMCSTLLPSETGAHPMALGFVYGAGDRVDQGALVAMLNDAARRCAEAPADRHQSYYAIGNAA